ncbi:hypothetical protein MSAN_00521900 [Mycena sanguinolenta]|uniref:Hydroxyneurosporene synthase n=1 Tax=Mycena sanguinolenta TaxID=230812 RepID=A0A8H6Z5V7_9AGAR|nr:hypothetical protein MSAN_00521900 [Mycena sanguinolenta]
MFLAGLQSSLLAVVATCFFASTTHAQPGQFTPYFVPAAVQNGTSHAQFTSTVAGIDAPKVQPINASAWDWWYFDVVSADPTRVSSVVVIFFTSPQSGFPLIPPSGSGSNVITTAHIFVSFPNGTLWSAAADAEGASVEAGPGGGSSGTWIGTGFSWTGSPGSGYLIRVDAPDIGVTGTINFRPTAPPHYPCGPVSAGQTLEVGPGIGWANAIPDAVSVVDLNIDGTRLAFSGSGYHDKNWSNQVFTSLVGSWYWGHGRIGAYSIVWFDFLDPTGKEAVSAYVAKENKIIATSCALGSITVRPTGQNATYPPVISTGNPSGYHIDFDLGCEGTLVVDVEVLGNIVVVNPEYGRFVGNMTGSVSPMEGEATTGLVGMALFEQFKLTA